MRKLLPFRTAHMDCLLTKIKESHVALRHFLEQQRRGDHKVGTVSAAEFYQHSKTPFKNVLWSAREAESLASVTFPWIFIKLFLFYFFFKWDLCWFVALSTQGQHSLELQQCRTSLLQAEAAAV